MRCASHECVAPGECVAKPVYGSILGLAPLDGPNVSESPLGVGRRQNHAVGRRFLRLLLAARSWQSARAIAALVVKLHAEPVRSITSCLDFNEELIVRRESGLRHSLAKAEEVIEPEE
jgi:hypothetical protein